MLSYSELEEDVSLIQTQQGSKLSLLIEVREANWWTRTIEYVASDWIEPVIGRFWLFCSLEDLLKKAETVMKNNHSIVED